MQVSRIVRALPVALGLAALAPAGAETQGRYRVTTESEWFHQEPDGRRLARLARGAVLGGGEVAGDWIRVTLEGWIIATSVGPSPRSDFDLVVTAAPEENLRAAPGGPLVGRLAEGFGLKRLAADGRWVRVSREGWVKREALTAVPDVAATRTAGATDSADSGGTQGAAPPDTTAPPSAGRAQPPRGTKLFRAPGGPEAGTIAAETPLRVVGRSGEWARVQVEGWVRGAELQAAPAGALVGVTAAELRAEPQRYLGQVLRWTLQFIALQRADDLRPDIPAGASYMLARGPLPERGFVYVIVSEGRLAALQALAPLAEIQVVARVRAGRSRYLGNPVVELISLEAAP